jgi:kynureninase
MRIPANGKRLRDQLARRGVICDFRPPDVLRAAPVPLYNTYGDVWRFVDELDRALSGD